MAAPEEGEVTLGLFRGGDTMSGVTWPLAAPCPQLPQAAGEGKEQLRAKKTPREHPLPSCLQGQNREKCKTRAAQSQCPALHLRAAQLPAGDEPPPRGSHHSAGAPVKSLQRWGHGREQGLCGGFTVLGS